jgi:hypothetical protein
MKFLVTAVLAFMLLSVQSNAQRVVYAEPDKDDVRSVNFEVIGKYNNQFLVYKNYRELHYICLYDNEMKMAEKEKLEFMPERVLNVEFVTYPDFYYMFYQYQRKSVMYLAAVKMDGAGKATHEPIIVDTTNVGFFANANSRLYSIITSENKEHISALKINSKNDKMFTVVNVLMNKNLDIINKSRSVVNMPERNDFLSEFSLDNEGDLVFLKASGTSSNDNVNKLALLTLKAGTSQLITNDLTIKDIYLDDVKVKVNNSSRQYVVSSFYSKSRRGQIEGLMNIIWDKASGKQMVNAELSVFNENFREDARGENNVRNAFDDFFLQQIVMRKDGGFIVTAESNYTTSRGNGLSRWDYLNASPFWSPSEYYLWRNYGYGGPWWRSYSNSNASTRFYSDNIAVMSFDNTGKMEWSDVVHKSQYDDNSDNFLSYSTMISGGEIHFLFNSNEKRTLLLTDQSVTVDGQLKRNPVFKNLDKGYEFMARFGKQVSARQMIIPCQYRNYISFAKVEF